MAYTDIDKPSDYFNTVLYTGNGSTQSITGVGFQPDWVWIKSRSQAVNHYGYDSVRGTDKRLQQNIDNAESTTDTTWFNSFDSDGFTIGSEANINNSSSTYASWNWLAGGTASSNTDGSTTANVSANTDAGFSIITYTGTGANATIGHGLNAVPKMILTKRRDSQNNWHVYHHSLGNTKGLYLDTTSATVTSSQFWNNTSPTSSVYTLGIGAGMNQSGATYVNYVFAEKKGFSKFGSYTGNGSADGTFIYTGFKPAFLIVKPTVTADNWVLMDNTRDGGINGLSKDPLYPNRDFAEGTTDQVDFVSNGVKIRNSGGTVNRSGEPFIYMAFAESPFTSSTGIPCTAR